MRPQKFKTRITELFGIRHPILCGGFMWLSDANYVAAGVNAGCMSFMTAKTFADVGRWREELAKCGELTGGKPYGVNLYASLRSEDSEMLKGHLEAALEAGVRHFETAGAPPTVLLPRLREASAVVVHKVAAVRHAISAAAKLDIDAITIVGMECGGHPGLHMVGTMVQGLVAAERIHLPVVIGGGIGHGRQIVAALGFGAEGVIIGTRFLVAEEIWSHDAVKQRVVEAGETDSALVLASQRNTYRVIDNESTRAVAALEAAGETDFEKYRPYVQGNQQKMAYETGDWNSGMLAMGQAAVFADKIEPMESIVDGLVDQASAGLERLNAVASAVG
ncbi:MAG: nitronate monooxygenase [Rhodospirillaceae bacterium]|nr:nitronate monooxygenase [Rhodospirillaceae bacterium]